jgi:hypothetical protein
MFKYDAASRLIGAARVPRQGASTPCFAFDPASNLRVATSTNEGIRFHVDCSQVQEECTGFGLWPFVHLLVS